MRDLGQREQENEERETLVEAVKSEQMSGSRLKISPGHCCRTISKMAAAMDLRKSHAK